MLRPVVFMLLLVLSGTAEMMAQTGAHAFFDPGKRSQIHTSLNLLKDTTVKKHSPKRASIMSAVLPGAGQFYNRKYWKIPVIYVGIGALAYSYKVNNTQFRAFRDAYLLRTDGDTTTIDQYNGKFSDLGLQNARDYYRRYRDLSAVGIAAVYILNIIDATVDAHLFEFEIDDDLSLKWQPSFYQTGRTACPVLSFSLKF